MTLLPRWHCHLDPPAPGDRATPSGAAAPGCRCRSAPSLQAPAVPRVAQEPQRARGLLHPGSGKKNRERASACWRILTVAAQSTPRDAGAQDQREPKNRPLLCTYHFLLRGAGVVRRIGQALENGAREKELALSRHAHPFGRVWNGQVHQHFDQCHNVLPKTKGSGCA